MICIYIIDFLKNKLIMLNYYYKFVNRKFIIKENLYTNSDIKLTEKILISSNWKKCKKKKKKLI